MSIKGGHKAPLRARRIALRAFYKFKPESHDYGKSYAANRVTQDRAGPASPLTEDDVLSLLEAPDVTSNYGLRDRTMLELMLRRGSGI